MGSGAALDNHDHCSSTTAVDADGNRFTRPYLLALNVALVEHEGRYWADASWAKDLRRHTEYIERLVLICPVERCAPPAGWDDITSLPVRIVGHGEPGSGWRFLLDLPQLTRTLWREIGKADLVHSGVAGWPFPLGWLTTPMARLRGKKIALIVESAFWRPPRGTRQGPAQRIKSALWEQAARWCMRQADYAAYTQSDYRASLPAPRANGGKLIQASWIDAEDCLSESAADADWARKITEPPRFLFASRMIAPKGTAILAAAIELLAAQGAAVFIDIIGAGPQLTDFAVASSSGWAATHVRLIEPVRYDAQFLEMLRRYHAVLVPSLSDEQPRIVYDAYSQAVPVIASDLPGLRACVTDGVTGTLVPPADSKELAAAIANVSASCLAVQGRAGLAIARQSTHQMLHRERLRELLILFR